MPICASCGLEVARCGFTKAQLGKKDSRRCKQCLTTPDAPGTALVPHSSESTEPVEDLEAALRTLTTPPFALNGEQYKTKQLLIARVGWKAAANVTPQSEEVDVGDAELNAHVTNQTKKAVNGVHQLIQAYNLWAQLLGPHKETYQPIPMTAKKETLRKGKPMAAMTAIRAKAGGFASIEEYEASLEAPAAEAAEEAEAAEGEGEGEGVAAVAAEGEAEAI